MITNMVGVVFGFKCFFGNFNDTFGAIAQKKEVGRHFENLFLFASLKCQKCRVAFECLLFFGAFGCFIEHSRTSQHFE